MYKEIGDVAPIFIGIIAGIMFVIGFTVGAIVNSATVKNTENTSLKQEYEEYVKENEWKNEYIEWLQNRIYEYEGDVSYEIQ